MDPVPKSKILLPLYIYPDPGAWDPLFQSIAENPAIDFIVIVNPHSGPGSEPWWPNTDYVRGIQKLNACTNVRTIGYVATTYCKRSIKDVLEDIEKYADWSKDERFAGLGVEGIFFDETTNLFSKEVKEYLDAITTKVKEADGILGDKIVIHNPGTAVDRRLAKPGPDITTIAEVAYAHFKTAEYQDWLATSPYKRERTSYMIHSIPEDVVTHLVQELRGRAEYLYVTDATKDFYHSFRTIWEKFVAAIAST